MASIATTDRLIERSARIAAGRGARHGQDASRAEGRRVARATEIGKKLFPPSEAELIAELIRRDLPYYDATISPSFVAGMNQFCARRRHPQRRRAV